MAGRSTRQRLKDHADRIDHHAVGMLDQLAAMEAIAEERSVYLTEAIPMMVVGVEELRHTIQYFFAGL